MPNTPMSPLEFVNPLTVFQLPDYGVTVVENSKKNVADPLLEKSKSSLVDAIRTKRLSNEQIVDEFLFQNKENAKQTFMLILEMIEDQERLISSLSRVLSFGLLEFPYAIGKYVSKSSIREAENNHGES